MNPAVTVWGATGRMPAGHGWQWEDPSHRSGYPGHLPDHPKLGRAPVTRFRCEGCGKAITTDAEVDDHKQRHGLVINLSGEGSHLTPGGGSCRGEEKPRWAGP